MVILRQVVMMGLVQLQETKCSKHELKNKSKIVVPGNPRGSLNTMVMGNNPCSY
jgi:hypothetical protein